MSRIPKKVLGTTVGAAKLNALRRLPETTLPELPRIADFATWGSAFETAVWPKGTFWSAYRGNRDEAVESVIDADPVASSVQTLMLERTEWTGTATDLLGELAEVAGERIAKARSWPGSPSALSGCLRRAATFLRKVGIDYENYREGRARTRMIRITRAADLSNQDDEVTQPSAASAPSAMEEKPNATNGLSDDGMRTVPGYADDPHDEPRFSVRANPLNNGGTDAADGEDASCSSPSGREKTNAGGWSKRL